jgi:hypothetical protein
MEPTRPEQPKSGLLSTEFYITLAKMVIGVLLASGVIKPADASSVEGSVTNGAVALAGLIAATYSVGQYIKSRTTLKTQTSQESSGTLKQSVTTEVSPTK